MTKIHFKTTGRTLEFPDGEDEINLLRVALRYDCGVPFRCASGNCGTDRVLVEEGAGNLSGMRRRERELLGPERVEAGYRLACQTYVQGDVTISWDPEQKPLISEKAADALREKWLSGPTAAELRAKEGPA